MFATIVFAQLKCYFWKVQNKQRGDTILFLIHKFCSFYYSTRGAAGGNFDPSRAGQCGISLKFVLDEFHCLK